MSRSAGNPGSWSGRDSSWRRTGATCGFTLVELLVVLGIITVLVALLLPAISGVRKKAQTAVCGAHLRSIGHALIMYTEQYRHYPACMVYDNQRLYAIWPVRLRPFTGGEQGVFYCPAQDSRAEWKKLAPEPGAPGRATELHARFGYEVGEPLLDRDGTFFSYGYNFAGGTGIGAPTPGERHKGLGDSLIAVPLPGFNPRELRSNRVRKPERMVAITDANADGNGDFAVKPDPYWGALARPGPIHNGGTNVLFCDGHVQWYPQKEILVTYDTYVPSEHEARRMWNNDYRVNAGDAYDNNDGG